MVQLCRCRLHGVHGAEVPSRVSRWLPLPSLLIAVLFVLWCTPLPHPYYATCHRPCHELDWPMICRYKLSVEAYESMGVACGQCPANRSHCDAAQCVPGDGSRRAVLTANRMLPGPAISVCENDIVVVDVVNRAAGQALGVHWGGQSQRDFPYMDGVPQVTQCPINTHTTFQYKFRASGAGTHLWGATGSSQAESVFGPLVVRQSDARDPHRLLFDEDVHLLTVSSLGTALLVNGRREHKAAALERGRRYRVRLLYAGGSPDHADRSPGPAPLAGPVTVSVPGLAMLVLAVDGHAVRPRAVRALTLWPGERADVVLGADQPPPSSGSPSDAFRLVAKAAQGPDAVELTDAIVTLPFVDLQKGKGKKAAQSSPTRELEGVHVADVLETLELEGLEPLPARLSGDEVDVRLHLPFDFQPLSGVRGDLSGPQPPAKPGSTPAPLGPPDAPWPRAVPRVCNISLALPASPLLTQPREAAAYDGEGGVVVCRGDARPAACPPHLHGGDEQSCECAHVIRVPLGSAMEIVLADQGGDGGRAHVFRLHGHSVWVVGRGAHSGPGPDTQRGSWEALAAADRRGKLLQRHLDRAVLKDIVTVPAHGAVALRFVADNPGYWLLREQSFYRWPAGLGVILQVGEEADLPPVPSDFPKCGSFVGPEFFLM